VKRLGQSCCSEITVKYITSVLTEVLLITLLVVSEEQRQWLGGGLSSPEKDLRSVQKETVSSFALYTRNSIIHHLCLISYVSRSKVERHYPNFDFVILLVPSTDSMCTTSSLSP
jgi:hypothetical protein